MMKWMDGKSFATSSAKLKLNLFHSLFVFIFAAQWNGGKLQFNLMPSENCKYLSFSCHFPAFCLFSFGEKKICELSVIEFLY